MVPATIQGFLVREVLSSSRMNNLLGSENGELVTAHLGQKRAHLPGDWEQLLAAVLVVLDGEGESQDKQSHSAVVRSPVKTMGCWPCSRSFLVPMRFTVESA
jgi:hypothetical protein